MRNLILIIGLLLCSCAPMPGNVLFPELIAAQKIRDVEVIVTVDIVETQQYCNQYAPWHQLLLNCITNGCFIPACAIPFYKDGLVKKCYIYLWIDDDYLMAHEERHCMGYKDLLY